MAVILGSAVINERIVRRALVTIVLLGLVAGLLAYTRGDSPLAHLIWGASTVPVVVALAVSIARDLFRGRMLCVSCNRLVLVRDKDPPSLGP